MLTYLDFYLAIERLGKECRATVLNSPGGEASRTLSLPVSGKRVEDFLSRYRSHQLRIKDLKDFGGDLFKRVFAGNILRMFNESLARARSQQAGLRIRLRLKSADLAALPWEYLYDAEANHFLGLSIETTLMRYIDRPEPRSPLAVQPPIRALVVISKPRDLPELDEEQEWARLETALKDAIGRHRLELERLEPPTLDMLRQRLRQHDYHMLHFIGHGTLDETTQEGQLAFQDEKGGTNFVSGQRLGTLIYDEPTLQLAILNACEGARVPKVDPFDGVAQGLVQHGVPAVIAMQTAITNVAALSFAREFYTAISDGYPVDAALAESRKAIFSEGNDLEWGVPVLYTSSPDGKILDIAAAEEPAQFERAAQQVALPATPGVADDRDAAALVRTAPSSERSVPAAPSIESQDSSTDTMPPGLPAEQIWVLCDDIDLYRPVSEFEPFYYKARRTEDRNNVKKARPYDIVFLVDGTDSNAGIVGVAYVVSPPESYTEPSLGRRDRVALRRFRWLHQPVTPNYLNYFKFLGGLLDHTRVSSFTPIVEESNWKKVRSLILDRNPYLKLEDLTLSTAPSEATIDIAVSSNSVFPDQYVYMSIKVRNNGKMSWPWDETLAIDCDLRPVEPSKRSEGGEQSGSYAWSWEVKAGNPMNAGETREFTVSEQAPTESGVYKAFWRVVAMPSGSRSGPFDYESNFLVEYTQSGTGGLGSPVTSHSSGDGAASAETSEAAQPAATVAQPSPDEGTQQQIASRSDFPDAIQPPGPQESNQQRAKASPVQAATQPADQSLTEASPPSTTPSTIDPHAELIEALAAKHLTIIKINPDEVDEFAVLPSNEFVTWKVNEPMFAGDIALIDSPLRIAGMLEYETGLRFVLIAAAGAEPRESDSSPRYTVQLRNRVELFNPVTVKDLQSLKDWDLVKTFFSDQEVMSSFVDPQLSRSLWKLILAENPDAAEPLRSLIAAEPKSGPAVSTGSPIVEEQPKTQAEVTRSAVVDDVPPPESQTVSAPLTAPPGSPELRPAPIPQRNKPDTIDAQIRGGVSGQIIVGNNNVQMSSVQISVAYEPPPAKNSIRLNVNSNTVSLTYNDQVYSSPNRIRQGALLEASGPGEYGGLLFDAIIHTEASLGAFQNSTQTGYDLAVNDSHGELRVEMLIDPSDPTLPAYKWEYLADRRTGSRPVAVNERSPFFRRIGNSRVVRGDKPKILVAICNPITLGRDTDDEGKKINENIARLVKLNVAQERDTVVTALDRLRNANLADYKILDGEDAAVTLEALGQELENGYNVLHLLAHGLFINGAYQLVMEKDDRTHRFVQADRFREMLAGHDLRLVVLAACQSATAETGSALRGLGPMLVGSDIPAVIAMQDEVRIDTAQFFTQRFYDDLARSGRVDMAMAATRFALYQRTGGKEWQWGIPVLLMSVSDGQLFEVDQQAATELASLRPVIKKYADPRPEKLTRAIETAARSYGAGAELLGALRAVVAPAIASAQPEAEQIAQPQDRVALGSALIQPVKLKASELKEYVESRGSRLALPLSLYRQLASALNAGKHVILIGPPGTGKTSLAQDVCNYAGDQDRKFATGSVLTTATADWTAFDTVGGYVSTAQNVLRFRPGIFLKAICAGHWLVIDEINRAEIDKAFGELFTVLSGQQVELPYTIGRSPIRVLPASGSDGNWVPGNGDGLTGYDYVIHPNWRILATMNVYDKSYLFAMSFAFMRRFAFIDIDLPDSATYNGLIDRWTREKSLSTVARAGENLPYDPNDMKTTLDTLRTLLTTRNTLMSSRSLGPAIIKDMLWYIGDRITDSDGAVPLDLLAEAFLLYVTPQLDGLDRDALLGCYGHIDRLFGDSNAKPSVLARIRSLYPHIPLDEFQLALEAAKAGP